jgi:hypothetical protein
MSESISTSKLKERPWCLPTLSHINLECVEYASDCQIRIRERESLCAKNRSGVAVWWVKSIEVRIWAGADAGINDL